MPGQKLRAMKDVLVNKAYAASRDLIEQSRLGKLQNLAGCDAEPACYMPTVMRRWLLCRRLR